MFIFRKLYQIRATTLQDKEEKVIVEDKFQAKGLQDTQREVADDKASESTPGRLESWVIKVEQSVNVFLTVCSLPSILVSFIFSAKFALASGYEFSAISIFLQLCMASTYDSIVNNIPKCS